MTTSSSMSVKASRHPSRGCRTTACDRAVMRISTALSQDAVAFVNASSRQPPGSRAHPTRSRVSNPSTPEARPQDLDDEQGRQTQSPRHCHPGDRCAPRIHPGCKKGQRIQPEKQGIAQGGASPRRNEQQRADLWRRLEQEHLVPAGRLPDPLLGRLCPRHDSWPRRDTGQCAPAIHLPRRAPPWSARRSPSRASGKPATPNRPSKGPRDSRIARPARSSIRPAGLLRPPRSQQDRRTTRPDSDHEA